jgi:hypothetical protein
MSEHKWVKKAPILSKKCEISVRKTPIGSWRTLRQEL